MDNVTIYGHNLSTLLSVQQPALPISVKPRERPSDAAFAFTWSHYGPQCPPQAAEKYTWATFDAGYHYQESRLVIGTLIDTSGWLGVRVSKKTVRINCKLRELACMEDRLHVARIMMGLNCFTVSLVNEDDLVNHLSPTASSFFKIIH